MSCKLDNLGGYTHRKKPYHAIATQLSKYNIDAMVELIQATNREASATRYGTEAIMVRFANPLPRQCTPAVMEVTDWLVVGENGVAKLYSDEQFKIKYEALND